MNPGKTREINVPKIIGICRYCQKEVSEGEAKSTNSYWHAVKDICHKACKEEGIKSEAYICQCIDAGCNDCKHFFRDSMIPSPYKYCPGWCFKFDKPTNAFAMTWCGKACFEHRKDPIKIL